MSNLRYRSVVKAIDVDDVEERARTAGGAVTTLGS